MNRKLVQLYETKLLDNMSQQLMLTSFISLKMLSKNIFKNFYEKNFEKALTDILEINNLIQKIENISPERDIEIYLNTKGLDELQKINQTPDSQINEISGNNLYLASHSLARIKKIINTLLLTPNNNLQPDINIVYLDLMTILANHINIAVNNNTKITLSRIPAQYNNKTLNELDKVSIIRP